MLIIIPCFLFLQVSTVASQLFNDASRCPSNLPFQSNLESYGNKCYEYVLNRLDNWMSAMEDCRFKQGHLVTIESPIEQLVVYNGLLAFHFQGDGVWIGLNDRDHEGTFIWDSGKSSSYRNWAKGQPGIAHAAEDCVLYKMKGSDGNGNWHDYPCDRVFINSQHHSWVCEYDITPKTSPTTTQAKQSFTSPPLATPLKAGTTTATLQATTATLPATTATLQATTATLQTTTATLQATTATLPATTATLPATTATLQTTTETVISTAKTPKATAEIAVLIG